MNKADIRQRLIDQLDWRPTSSADFTAVLDRFINRGQQVLFNDASYLFEGDARIVTQPDVTRTATVATDVLTVNATDTRVMERPQTVGRTAWTFDGTWNGRWVEITDPTGQIHRRQIGAFFQSAIDARDRFTITESWPRPGDANMAYRIVTPEYYLPSDAVEIRSARLWADPNHNLTVITEADAEEYRMVDFRGRHVSYPKYIFLGKHFQLPVQPTRAPTVAASGAWGNIAANDNAGQFDYAYTYVWGLQDADRRTTDNGFGEVLWESAPSPISATITVTNAGTGVLVTTPQIHDELGYGGTGVAAAQSGFGKRIYARRYTSAVDGAITRYAESPQVFMLVDQNFGTGDFVHTGAARLDYRRRLKTTHGYRAVRFFPMPDARYEFDCRVQYRPEMLVNDQDTPHLGEDAADALIQKCLEFFYDYDKQPDMSAKARAAYRDMLATLSKRYGSLGWGVTTKQPARVYPAGYGVRRSKNAIWNGIS